MADRKRKRKKDKKKKGDKKVDDVELYKHYETFYEAPPPGLVQVEEEKPEDCIPDLPENEKAREFLAKAPSKGLWMPLGKEVKVMKCWRCKTYGHRTGDRECPLFTSGNESCEKFRMAHEDPMHGFIAEKKKTEKEERIEQLKALLEEPTTSEEDSSSSSDTESNKHKKQKKTKHRKHKSKKESKRSNKPHKKEKEREYRNKDRQIDDKKYKHKHKHSHDKHERKKLENYDSFSSDTD